MSDLHKQETELTENDGYPYGFWLGDDGRFCVFYSENQENKQRGISLGLVASKIAEAHTDAQISEEFGPPIEWIPKLREIAADPVAREKNRNYRIQFYRQHMSESQVAELIAWSEKNGMPL